MTLHNIEDLKSITFNLNREFFDEIKKGIKLEEYRECKPFWEKRLKDKNYDVIIIKLGYPKKGADEGKVLYFKWNGYTVKNIVHKIFDYKERTVFAIDLSEPLIV